MDNCSDNQPHVKLLIICQNFSLSWGAALNRKAQSSVHSYHSNSSTAEDFWWTDSGEVGNVGQRVHGGHQDNGDPDGLGKVPVSIIKQISCSSLNLFSIFSSSFFSFFFLDPL